ncbi:DUF413 domain-containing protein [Vibrio viridaestus]|uniref:Macrodomain Ori protein n=1 Tax=Vibrio viridaestus TaxID=2487322 RepID=A0A3N9U9U9_9VIBR|nr:DUF413 domain-containing protein [Vibrio viridaestus]RQW65056.1 DUF413 domain-containing protein [Vibrio viridaestus]
MSQVEFRPGQKRFYDTKKFPRGFAKSGDFTIAEEDLLTRFGDTMLRLETGDLSPSNQEEAGFMAVMLQEKSAETKLEKVWVKYVQLSRGRKRFHTLNGRSKPDNINDDYVDEDQPLADDD